MECGVLQRKNPPDPGAVQAVQDTAMKMVQDTVVNVVMSLKDGSRMKKLFVAGTCALVFSLFYRAPASLPA